MRDGVVHRVLTATHQQQLDGAVSRRPGRGVPHVSARDGRGRTQARRDLLQLVQHRCVAQLQAMRPVCIPGFCERLRIGIQVPVRVLLDQVERHATAAHELLHQLLGRRRVLHVDRLAAIGELHSHPAREFVEDAPVGQHLRSGGRLDQARLVLCVRLLVADRQSVRRDALVAERHRRLFQPEPRTEDVVRKTTRRRNLRIDDDEQVERLERAAGLGLVGPGQQRVAADDDQCTHLPLARRQDFVGKRRGRQAGGGLCQAANAQRLAETDARSRLLGTGDTRELAEQHPSIGHWLARTNPAPAHRVERQHEVIHQHAVRRHARPGAARGVASPCPGECSRSLGNLRRRHAGQRCDALRGERCHGGSQRFESLRLCRDEIAVVQALGKNDAEHRREEFDIVTRQALQVNVRLAGRLRHARVDDDQPEPAGTRLVQSLRRIERRDATPHRHQRVGTHEQADVGVGEGLRPRAPSSMQRHRDRLARLVDGGVAEAHRRADRVHEGVAQHDARGAEMTEGAAVHRNRARAVLRENSLELVGNAG